MNSPENRQRLGNLFAFKNGRAFKKEEWCSEGLPIIRIQNLNNESATFNHYGGEFTDDILVRNGDLLFSWSGTVGSSFGPHIWQRDKGLLNQHIFAISFKTEMNKRYAYYALEEITEEIEKQVSGAVGLVHITKEKLNEFKVPVPSVPEQRRIVALLDEAFDGIATAKANAEKNLQNARAIFESHLQSVFAEQGVGWRCLAFEETVDSACTLSYGIVQPGEEYAGGLPIVRPTDLGTKIIEVEGLKRIDPALANSFRRTTLRGGDLLLCVRGTTGQISIASADLAGANVTRGIVPIFFERTVVSQDFGYYLMRSGVIQSQIREKTYGTALQQINIGDLRNLKLPIPPKAEQEALAKKFGELSEQTQRLDSIYQQKLAALNELKKSLLHQAFSGNL